MKISKKIISVFLIIVLVFSTVVVSASAVSTGITELSVTTKVGEKELEVKWWNSSEKYFLFMPSDADLSELTVKFAATGDVLLGDTPIASGDKIQLEANREYTLSCEGNTYALYPMKSSSIPSLHITTSSGSMSAVHADKSHKEPANIVISSGGEIILEKELEYIKGRGNATWRYAKKPYNIKFDKKTSLFGMDKAKKWTLLANHMDETLMRNHTALNIAASLGIPFTSEHISVDLYINNEYYGNYVLCESVEIGDGRVEITDLKDANEEANPDIDIEECSLGGDHQKNFKLLKANTQKWVNIPNNPEDISGGYLLEYELPDRYVNEISGFVTNRNQTIVVKEPEYASEAQVKYISQLYQLFEDAVYSDTGLNSLGKHYSEYIDFESFVRMYVFQEFTKNIDAAITSFYIYKDVNNDKFVAAPVWDFDMALGESYDRFGMNIDTPDGWWAGVIYHWTENDIKTLPTVLNALYQKDDFFAAACQEWETSLAPIISDEFIAELSDYAEMMMPSATMNANRWNAYPATDYDTVSRLYMNDVNEKFFDFISARKEFLNKGFNSSSVRIFFKTNGGTGNMFNESAVNLGDRYTVPACTFVCNGFTFDSWNTAPDASGTTYYPGDTILLEETKLILYAVWKMNPPTPDDSDNTDCDHLCHEDGFLGFIWKIVNMFNKLFRINKTCVCGASHY